MCMCFEASRREALEQRGARWRALLGWVACLLLLVSCGRSADEIPPDDGSRLKEFGELCTANEQCRSTYCLSHPTGAFCTHPCPLGCPPGWVCQDVPDPHGGEARVALCTVTQHRLCGPCLEDRQCNVSGADLCLPIGDGRYCAADCSFAACPEGYTCRDVPGQGNARQCLPDYESCACTEENRGMVRGCEATNAFGTCTGYERCEGSAGWGECQARVPAAEVCNGIDDDCNGFVDEGLEGEPCAVSNDLGTCHGMTYCAGVDGWLCDAAEPQPEMCNGLDDDCNGGIDDPFVDAVGRYVHVEHCGACGKDCAKVIANAVETACEIIDGAPQCRAVACAEGYFVYGDGLACLALPANLCLPCAEDRDCMAPNSRCIDTGFELFCGRSCAPDSPYGPRCPDGYQCEAYDGTFQCLPVSHTCLCDVDALGTARSCLVDTCVGFQHCEATAQGFAWSTCNIADYNTEICDGHDNNCDGIIDEGFINPATGRYDSAEHCGFCYNDCSLYWVPELHHTEGVCQDTGVAMPRCVMGPCHRETEGGITYEWVDVNGRSDDGCECRRVQGNTLQDPPDLIGDFMSGYVFHDENCDGIDGVIGDALFVRAGASGGDGSLSRPFGSIGAALSAFASSGKAYILVAEGRYDEDLRLLRGVVLHGGYSADFRSRDVVRHAAIVRGVTAYATVTVEGVTTGQTLMSGFIIEGRDMPAAAENQDGQASVAVFLKDTNHSAVLRSNRIVAGRGGDGGRGSSGAAGHGRQADTALDGGNGLDGQRLLGPCFPALNRAGGRAGLNAQCGTSNATRGGTSRCPVFEVSTNQGGQAEYREASANKGLGGWDWSFDHMSGSGCHHATESGYPSAPQSNVGGDGRYGADGTAGQGGAGGRQGLGSFVAGRWVPAPDRAVDGVRGTDGVAGGGGGAGGGTAQYTTSPFDCQDFELGPSGGGGGAGGCGGRGGLAGRQGGASLAIVIANTGASALTLPTLRHNEIVRGQGGKGGNGGFGGMGGIGGRGGFGGGAASWIASQGGRGGDGGNGGPGGGGGGGAGGPSFDVVGLNVDTVAVVTNNTVVLEAGVPTGGAGGAGGPSVGSGASGVEGRLGAFGQRRDFVRCQTGGSCASGYRCDANNICVPTN